MTAFTHIDTLRSKPVDEFQRPVTRRERHIPRHFYLTCTACGRAARTAHCPPKSLARYMNEEHEGLIPFERYQGDLKQEFMLMEVGSQKRTEFVRGLHYLIERSEGDCVKPVTRQQGAGHDGGHSRRNQCDWKDEERRQLSGAQQESDRKRDGDHGGPEDRPRKLT